MQLQRCYGKDCVNVHLADYWVKYKARIQWKELCNQWQQAASQIEDACEDLLGICWICVSPGQHKSIEYHCPCSI